MTSLHADQTFVNVIRPKSCRIGAGVRLGVPGFGYDLQADGSWLKKEEHYGVILGEDVEIGANTVIARGSYRDTFVGRGTKIDACVFIAHNCLIGEDCLIVAEAEISGSVVVGNGTIIGPGATIKEHVNIGSFCLIGAGAVVLKDVPAGQVWVGNPARYLRERRPGEAV